MIVSHSRNGELVANPREFKGPVERANESDRHREPLPIDRRPLLREGLGRPPPRDVDALRSAAFRDWLIDGYFRSIARSLPTGPSAASRGALEAIARFEGGTPSIFVRVGHDGKHGSAR